MAITKRANRTSPRMTRLPSLLDRMDLFTRGIWDSWEPVGFDMGSLPAMDVHDGRGGWLIKAEIPGVKPKDLEVTLEGDRLTIKAERKEKLIDDKTRRATGRYYEQYYHSMTVPYPVKEDGISADFKKGVLKLRLPRGEEVKPKRIEIKAQTPQADHPKLEGKPKEKAS